MKIFGPGGIDQKTNPLLANPLNPRDALNVRHNKLGEYSKRRGIFNIKDLDSIPEYKNLFASLDDTVFVRNINQHISISRNGTLYKTRSSNNLTGKDIIRSTDYRGLLNQIPNDLKKTICVAENIGTSLFTIPEANNNSGSPVIKYDGQFSYLAGLPAPIFESNTAAVWFKYTLSYFSFIDSTGNIIDGPSTILSGAGASGVLSPLEPGFLYIFMSCPPGTYNRSNRTMTFSFESSITTRRPLSVGDKIPVRSSSRPSDGAMGIEVSELNSILMLEIEDIDWFSDDSCTITFTEDSFNDLDVIVHFSDINFHGGLVLKSWGSSNEFTGYRGGTPSFTSNLSVNPDGTIPVKIVSPILYPQNFPLLSSEYDITTSKLRPPFCRYISMYGYQLVCGNVYGFYDFENNLIKYPNNDIVIYSDVSAGDTAENFTENNRQLIGETQDGFISGLCRYQDSLVVFKNTGLYSLDGVLLPGNYSIRKIPSDGRGTTSYKSIIETSRGLFFQANDGMYSTDTYDVKYVSAGLEVNFLNVDPSLTRSVINTPDYEYLFPLVEKNKNPEFEKIPLKEDGVFANGLYYVFGSNSVMFSDNGENWKSFSIPSGNWGKPLWINSISRVVCFNLGSSSNQIIKINTDDNSFDISNSGVTGQFKGNQFLRNDKIYSDYSSTNDGVIEYNGTSSVFFINPLSPSASELTGADNDFIYIKKISDNTLYRTTDLVFTDLINGIAGNPLSIQKVNNLYVCHSLFTPVPSITISVIQYSDDLISWNPFDADVSERTKKLYYGNDKIYSRASASSFVFVFELTVSPSSLDLGNYSYIPSVNPNLPLCLIIGDSLALVSSSEQAYSNDILSWIGLRNNYIFTYNFTTNAIFWWDGINSQNGINADNNGIVYFFGSDGYSAIFSDDLYDSINNEQKPINSWIKTAWFDLGEPSLLKKFVGFRIFSFSNKGQIVKYKTYNDWNEERSTKMIVSENLSDRQNKTAIRMADNVQAHSISILLQNDIIGEDLNISGYEVMISVIQDSDKNRR